MCQVSSWVNAYIILRISVILIHCFHSFYIVYYGLRVDLWNMGDPINPWLFGSEEGGSQACAICVEEVGCHECEHWVDKAGC